MGKFLLHIKRKLYLYVFLDLLAGLAAGYYWDMGRINLRPFGFAAVFIMLYPMLTGIAIEKVKRAGRNFKLIFTTLGFAFFVASATAFFISRTILKPYPEVAFAMVMVGAIPCSNMLIGWAGIADASVEDALVIAVSGLLLIPVISPFILKLSGGVFVSFHLKTLILILLSYIILPLALGLYTRRTIIKKKGMDYFMEIRKFFPGVSALGILLIVFFSVSKVARLVVKRPVIFLVVVAGLLSYYIIQTLLSVLAAKALGFNYAQGMILILGATASSQAISLSVAATMFPALTVFALAFKPILQVLYIMLLIYGLGPWLRRFMGGEPFSH